MKNIDSRILEQALTLLERHLSYGKNAPLELVICGGSALIATRLVTRTTKDLEGFENRLISHVIGPYLKVHFISRLDQIHFKLYASVDRGGYHIEDLLSLDPSEDELIIAGRWSRTHDVSDGYAMILRDLLNQLGYKYAASRV